jgi:hypothetical protein
LDLDLDSDDAEEVPGLASDNDDFKEFFLLSNESISSPAKPNLLFHPKHIIIDVEGGRDLVM